MQQIFMLHSVKTLLSYKIWKISSLCLFTLSYDMQVWSHLCKMEMNEESTFVEWGTVESSTFVSPRRLIFLGIQDGYGECALSS
jgi:hypothetical protein